MEIKNLAPLEYAGKRVLLSKQLGEAYGISSNAVKDNFGRAKEKFVEERDFFRAVGDGLRQLKSQVKDCEPALIGKFATIVYLWTKDGAAKVCDLVNTPQAPFAALERDYFNTVDTIVGARRLL
ncbi:MAG: ORF6N domain-containing protein [Selenomonadaceae bacterium]|nr:ORF6N domain-containing protein [Selenomonadaceae bacterium]